MPITTPWTTITPTINAGSLGNGDLAARTRRVNGAFLFMVKLWFGSTTALSGVEDAINLTVEPLPAPTWGEGQYYFAVPCLAENVGVSAVPGVARLELITPEGGDNLYTGIRLTPWFAGGVLSATVPFTWGVNDMLMIGNTIEAFDN